MQTSKAVLVTGCSTGIGRAAALALVRAGLPTWASARRLDSIADLAAVGCRTIELDVTVEESRIAAVKAIEQDHGAVGALVNNAGFMEPGPLEEVSLESLQRQFDANVFGLLRMCQLVLPAMRAQRAGRIINIGSMAGLVATAGVGSYSMTKFALEALTDALRYEVRPFGVRVVLLQPAGVRTEFLSSATASMPPGIGSGPYEAFKEGLREYTHNAHRAGARGVREPEDIAHVVVEAVTVARPRTRYKIGAVTRLVPPLRRALGDRAWDAIMTRTLPMD
jgi:NAD(P)-dependent dehydrogenase (short-subunit alcohol dehydrogenase family)